MGVEALKNWCVLLLCPDRHWMLSKFRASLKAVRTIISFVSTPHLTWRFQISRKSADSAVELVREFRFWVSLGPLDVRWFPLISRILRPQNVSNDHVTLLLSRMFRAGPLQLVFWVPKKPPKIPQLPEAASRLVRKAIQSFAAKRTQRFSACMQAIWCWEHLSSNGWTYKSGKYPKGAALLYWFPIASENCSPKLFRNTDWEKGHFPPFFFFKFTIKNCKKSKFSACTCDRWQMLGDHRFSRVVEIATNEATFWLQIYSFILQGFWAFANCLSSSLAELSRGRCQLAEERVEVLTDLHWL
jgi:hypothetical protein